MNSLNNKITIFLKPTANRNAVRAAAYPKNLTLGKGFCFKIELYNPLGMVIDTKFLWIEGELFNNWPAGGLESDLEYFKPLLLAKINQEESGG